MSSRRCVSALVTVGVLAACSPGALAAKPGKWERVTHPNGRNIDQVARQRTADGTLHLAWALEESGGTSLFHTPISATGAVGGTTPIQTGWSTINSVPDLVPTPDGGIRVFFGGLRTTNSDETNDELSTATAPASGAPWALTTGNVTQGGAAAYASDVGATVLADGTPLQSWGGTGAGVFVHQGLSPSSPNHAYQSQLGGCCGYSPDLAVDSASGVVFIAWYSNASDNLGVFVQPVDPGSGAPLATPQRMPGTVTDFSGRPSSSQMLARTPITARPGQPGVFVAYPGGYPTTTKVLVWQIGGKLSVLDNSKANHLVGLAADPNGRLWGIWAIQGGTPAVFARRSNLAATKWGPRVAAGAPKGAASVYKIDGDAQLGRLDLLGLFGSTGSTATWHSQLLPGLSLAAKPSKTKHAKTEVTFTVTDPDPVPGAKVTVPGDSGTTDSKGKVTLDVGPFGSKVKKTKATATKSGYKSGKLTMKVSG
jgi:hypothetical protein